MVEIYQFDKYEDYITSQMRNEELKHVTAGWDKVRAQDIATTKSVFPKAKSVLCIGCRDESEVTDFHKAGFTGQGIDLFTSSDHVEKLDMHKMGDRFSENEFDVAYMSHSLEHCHDPKVVFESLSKITKMGVWIVLPNTKKADPHDSCIFDFMKADGDFDLAHSELSKLTSRKFILEACNRRNARGREIIFAIKWI